MSEPHLSIQFLRAMQADKVREYAVALASTGQKKAAQPQRGLGDKA